MIARLLQLQRDGGRAVVLTIVEGEGLGSKLLVVEGGETVGDGPPMKLTPSTMVCPATPENGEILARLVYR